MIPYENRVVLNSGSKNSVKGGNLAICVFIISFVVLGIILGFRFDVASANAYSGPNYHERQLMKLRQEQVNTLKDISKSLKSIDSRLDRRK